MILARLVSYLAFNRQLSPMRHDSVPCVMCQTMPSLASSGLITKYSVTRRTTFNARCGSSFATSENAKPQAASSR